MVLEEELVEDGGILHALFIHGLKFIGGKGADSAAGGKSCHQYEHQNESERSFHKALLLTVNDCIRSGPLDLFAMQS